MNLIQAINKLINIFIGTSEQTYLISLSDISTYISTYSDSKNWIITLLEPKFLFSSLFYLFAFSFVFYMFLVLPIKTLYKVFKSTIGG